MKKTLWVIRKAIKHCFKYVLGLVLVMIISTAISIGINIINKNMINMVVDGIAIGRISKILIFVIFLYIFIWIFSNFIGYLQAFANNLFRLKVDVFMQKIFMYKSNKINQESFFKKDFMDRYNFICANTYKASSFIFNMTTTIFSNISIIISAIILFVLNEPLLIIYTVFVIFIYVISTIVISKKQYALSREQINEERISEYYRGIFINKNTAKDMRMYKFSNFIFQKWKKNNNKYQEKRYKVENKRSNYSNIVNVINYCVSIFVVFLLIVSVKQGKCDVGTFIMLIGITEESNKSIKALINTVMSGIFNDTKYFREYYDFVNPLTKEDLKNISHMDELVTLNSEKFVSLDIENVSYKYPGANKYAVDNVSLHIKRGEIVSIIGYNGSGKTTLTKLINYSLNPKSGSIRINDNVYRVKNKEDIFKFFGVGPQEYSCYSLTIRENVGLGCIEQMNDMSNIEKAYEDANLIQTINKFEKLDETIIGKEYDDDGIQLSGGEQQKVIIGSAYMGNPEFLILDEPTASIDPIKEFEMIKNFRRILKDRTAILVSHRIGFARLADRIVVMKDGKVVEEGSHQELINKNGYYADMFNKQKKLYET